LSEHNPSLTKKNTKDRILEAAIELFAQRGYTGVSVRDITKEVGVKESSLYNHFKNKEDVLNTILELFYDEIGKTSFSLETIEEGLNHMDLSGFLQHHAFMLRQKNTPLMIKIRKIIYMEQFRDERALNFILKGIIEAPSEFYKRVFQIAHEKGMIKNNNPEMLAMIYQYTALTIFWELMLREANGEDIAQYTKKIFNLIEFLCER